MMRRLAILSFVVLGCSQRASTPSIAHQQAPLTDGGHLSSVRSMFAWTPLPSGNFLISGGYAAGGVTDEHDSWNPTTKTWTSVPHSIYQHNLHSITWSPALSRAVLIGSPHNELFDPSTNTWTDEQTLVQHWYATTTVLSDGRFLVAGGNDGAIGSSSFPDAELYDPSKASGSRISSAGAMVGKRILHQSFLLSSGKVLAVGGRGVSDEYLSTAESWNPATKTWSSATAMSTPRVWFAGELLADKRVFVAGGYDGNSLSTVEIYDPATDTWSNGTSMSTIRSEATATRLSTGRILVVGGDDGTATASKTTELYDPVAKTWTPGPSLTTARWEHSAIPVGDGRVLIVGGLVSNAVRTSSVEVFGGLANGAVCVVDEECVSGSCKSGICAAKGDAGADTSVVDSGADTFTPDTFTPDTFTPDTKPAVDSAPAIDSSPIDSTPAAPDTGAKPQLGGGFSGCKADSECATGHCVDGVCCDTSCAEACHSCTLPWAPGICTLEPYGTDRRNACGASGSCVGTCDGKGACVPAGKGTQCAPTRCTGPAEGRGAAYCADKGAACDTNAGDAFDCSPYACIPAFGACASSCTTSDDCAPGLVCDQRTCVAPTQGDPGGCAYGGPSSTSLAGLAFALVMLGRLRRR